MKKTILITGAAGFLGSHVIEEILINTDWNIIGLCRLTYVGDIERIINSTHVKDFPNRIKLVYHDLKFEIPGHMIDTIGHVDYIAHIAANSHVDRSIKFPKQFFEDNVLGTINLLEWYRIHNPSAKFINFLTDEIFGPADDDYNFKENDRWNPCNPYSASKAGQASAGVAYHNTYGLPIIGAYTMNLFGERQHPEKLVCKSILSIKNDQIIPIHAKVDASGNVEYVGQRHWLHARNAASATLFLLNNGKSGEYYNIVGDTELHNDELVRIIGDIMNKTPKITYVDFSSARPGHDRRYGLDGTKIKDLGWTQPVDFLSSLKKTVKWILDNGK